MATAREQLTAIAKRMGLVPVAAETIYQQNDFSFDQKGLSPGVEAGVGADSMAIWRSGAGKKIDRSKAMAQNSGWVYAATKAISDEIANIDFRLFRVKKGGDKEEVMDHEVLDLLDAVNDFQTGPELKQTIAQHLELTGNAFILLDGVTSEKGKPTALYTLNPGSVRTVLNKTIYPFKIARYEFTIEGRKFAYQPWQIVHLKYPDPNDPYDGIGTVQAIAEWIDNDNYAMEHNRRFFVQGAQIGGVLESEFTTDAQIASLRMGWDTAHSGVENAHKVVVLPKGVKFTATQASMKDMDFGTLLDKMQDRILGGFRTSRTMLGTAESETNRATAETADYVFAKRTIKPKMKLICSYLNEFLVPRFGSDIYLDFHDPTPEDKAFKITEMQATVASQPVMSVNEAREAYLGLEPVEGGDAVMAPTGMLPLSLADEASIDVNNEDNQNTPDPEEEPRKAHRKSIKTTARPVAKKKDTRRIPKTRGFKAAAKRSEIANSLAEKIAARMAEIKEKKAHRMTHEEYSVIHRDFIARVERSEHDLRNEMVRVNNQLEKHIISNLPKIMPAAGKAVSKKTIDTEDLYDSKEWIQHMVDAVRPILLDLLGKEATAAVNLVGKPGYDITNDPIAKQALDNAIALLSDSYDQTTRVLLKTKLTEGLESGASLDQITELVKGVFDYNNQVRASMVAKTETFRTANYATKEAWKKTGVVKTIKWFTAPSGVCPFCKELDGKVISIESDFFSKGDTIKAGDQEMSLDYSDVGAPPLHVNCNCYTQPDEVTLEDDSSDDSAE